MCNLIVNRKVHALLAMAAILWLAVSCGILPLGTQADGEKQTRSQTRPEDVIHTEQEDSAPYDTAFRGSSFLIRMDDLKAINMAANYLKNLGETVTFQETYIEYHDAGSSAVNISLADGESVEYRGDYLEVRLYQSEDPKDSGCEHCTVVYISQDGKILGRNKIFSGISDQDSSR